MKKSKGFTLIEVLVALAIISIALTAMLKAAAQYTQNTLYIQNKTLANWVGMEVMNEIRLGLLKPPISPDNLTEDKEMLGQQWVWEAHFKNTPNADIKEIDVTVYQKLGKVVLVRLVSYLYVA